MRSVDKKDKSIGLALSGGGFRATLFHAGSLWRLNELGRLSDLTEITSVSGGSIIAGLLGLHWKRLSFDANGVSTNYHEEIIEPLRDFCSRTIDVGSIIGGLLSPFRHPSDLLISNYRKYLFGDATLQQLPTDEEGPRFTIYATSLQTGASVRFSRPYMAEYHLGTIESPELLLAQVVGASSAFPPPLCPVILKMKPDAWQQTNGADLHDNEQLKTQLFLADGGVYDNLGLERIWDQYQTVIVSDGGAPLTIKPYPRLLKYSQIFRTKRALSILSEQTRALRKRKLISDFQSNKISGAYWGIATQITNYELEQHGFSRPMVSDNDITRALAKIRTRLNRFSSQEQGRLINWGYALTDAAMRRHVLKPRTEPGQWPLPEYSIE